ncbi:deoxyguanosinetriphosphate triphosphohydrolase [Moraxella porci]|uniref:deoxyguanosinetriphosphate triphosphohydrolase n=1 Tax=Moraxella porci TaxID=1288392 RepID=UPI0024475E4B|nr:deoxyguanosinetriphosphate triphosphohydrolase [Moraxella porci]MDH2273603.1 deoxyguanosinetriphosphate triphosphohydrolase [Moraxella porci]
MNWKYLLNSDRFSGSFQDSDLSSDYKRIITSPAFRRLQDKTQVFPLNRGDFVRTRLTHSLEVAAIAKTIAYKVSNDKKRLSDDDKEQWQSNLLDIQTVLECAALLHDIGNPPFGHFGETVIRSWFKDNIDKDNIDKDNIDKDNIDKDNIDKDNMQLCNLDIRLSSQQLNDFLQFEGNAQALRIITKLHQFSTGKDGMNLSYATLNTIIKYTRHSNELSDGKIVNKKVGYFYSEKDTFDKITSNTHCKKNRHPLTFILEAADDIAYLTADIEDAIKKDIVKYEDFEEYLNNFIKQDTEYSRAYQDNQAYTKVYKDIQECKEDCHLFLTIRNKLIWCAASQFAYRYNQIMQGEYDADLFKGSFVEKLHKSLQDFCVNNIFNHRSILELEVAGHTTLSFLLDKFVPAAINFADGQGKCSDALSKRLIGLISESQLGVCKAAINANPQDAHYYALLMVTDFISGMTDGYATDLYKKLSGIQV